MRFAADENMDEFASNWDTFRDRLVVFLGAGASKGAVNIGGKELPSAYELRNLLWQRFKVPAGTDFDPATIGLMSLEHAAAIIEEKVGRDALSDFLFETFVCDKPLWPHRGLPYLGAQAIFTTNYDQLVEFAYPAPSGKLLDIICDGRMPSTGQIPLYKPHGSLSHRNQPVGEGGLVITQFDYFDMLAEYRKMLKQTITSFKHSCVLVIGYSFGDMDIGSELYALRKANSGTPWYAVFPRGDSQVKGMYARRLNIRQINRTFENFMADLDQRVGFLPQELKRSRIARLRSSGKIQ